jgi:hypothetical protein
MRSYLSVTTPFPNTCTGHVALFPAAALLGWLGVRLRRAWIWDLAAEAQHLAPGSDPGPDLTAVPMVVPPVGWSCRRLLAATPMADKPGGSRLRAPLLPRYAGRKPDDITITHRRSGAETRSCRWSHDAGRALARTARPGILSLAPWGSGIGQGAVQSASGVAGRPAIIARRRGG